MAQVVVIPVLMPDLVSLYDSVLVESQPSFTPQIITFHSASIPAEALMVSSNLRLCLT